ncbi:MAG TPA: ethanolamine ammonia-lyase reactivating factor EutA [Firmicutes bacterium]|nr:ethanolamine ammonia-lyase reactivating factor EutA [Bacillota bacterium]
MGEREKQTILSMGLDIGTTTTIVVISELTVKNIASATSVPRIEIVDKRISHMGEVHFTPLIGEDSLDEDALMQIVLEEYRKAGVKPEEIQSGAVIVTGHSALKRNAEKLLHKLATNIGKFVVATAGPHLEAFIAGRGSGAAARSLAKKETVANLDVGGGTTNISFFDNGEPKDALAINVGGRLLKLDPGSGKIRHISGPGQTVLDSLGMRLRAGDRASLEELTAIAKRLAEVIEEVMNGALSPLAVSLMIGEPRGPRVAWKEISFSGGVGRLVYERGSSVSFGEAIRYGDIGPLLAQQIRRTRLWAAGNVFEPDQTIYATVIGAGAYTTELSGSTIYLSDPKVLPLRDVPVAKPAAWGTPPILENVKRAVAHSLAILDLADGNKNQPVALAVDLAYPRFGEIKTVAAGIAEALGETWRAPIVIVGSGDFGKVLGQTLVNQIGGRAVVVSIDQIRVENGDYIDIGEPLYSGTVVPVIVKTLVFGE